MIFQTAAMLAASSYLSWYIERHELAMVYPFDETHISPIDSGEPRLKETRFTTTDGHSLVVWRAMASNGRPTILYFPGNAGGLKDRTERFSRLIDRGFGVVAMAYRGSSGSGGKPEEHSITTDALALASSLGARPLILYGESLGTGVAIKLAAKGLGDAIVLEAPFTSIADIVEVQFPLDDLDHLLTQRWQSRDFAAALDQPLLVIHGDRDKVIPIEQGREIYELAGSATKMFHAVRGKGHRGLWTSDMQMALFAFLGKH